MIELGIKELAGIGAVLIACIGSLWKIIGDYRKKEDARFVATEDRLTKINHENKNIRTELEVAKVKFAYMDGQFQFVKKVEAQIAETNELTKAVLEKVEGKSG